METPRRITRSQNLATFNSNSNNIIPMSRKNGESDRTALIDISNDSPIVGLAIVSSVGTPTSKKRNNNQSIKTPGSGEALLRGQVKTLLQKVEEEEAELSKLSLEHKPFSYHLKGCCFINSPVGLLAPTPTNTPLVRNLCDDEGFKNCCLALVPPSPVQEQLMIPQNSQLGISLTFDKRRIQILERGKEKSSSMEEEEAQGNASSKDDDDDDDEEDGIEKIEENEGDDYAEEEEEGDEGGFIDELCERMSSISVCEGKLIPKFSGKHTRFVYNSDDEIEGEEAGGGEREALFGVSSSIVRLKGLPTPEGFFQFQDEVGEEEYN